ncbi:cytochrome c oxidase assembly protein [Jatrophihabitans sp. YIM 134969]
MASLLSPVAVPDHPMGFGGLVTAWTLQPAAVLVAVVVLVLYARAVARTPGWPVRRSVAFGIGVAVFVWTSCGFLELYGHTLFWVWTVQALVLLLVVPVLVMAGQPLELARRRRARLGRLTDTAPGRVLTSPVVGPLLVPAVTSVLVFGPLAGWAVAHPPVEWLTQLGVLVVGCAIALPLVAASSRATSLAVGLALAVGVFELLLDAVPGFALRFQTHITTAYFDLRPAADQLVAALTPIKDQQRAGGIVWVVAELLDLPFVILLFRQWVKADARDARSVDTVLDAEAIAHRASAPSDPAVGDTTRPWWESDDRLRDRYR